MPFEVHSTSSAQATTELGHLLAAKMKAPEVILLVGDLGSGKTTLAKGIIQGLGVANPEDVLSPTFSLIHEYEGPPKVYHIDLYRLDERDHVWELGLDEYLEGDGVCVIEWADMILDQLPEHTIQVKLCWISESSRTIEVNSRGNVSTHTLPPTKE